MKFLKIPSFIIVIIFQSLLNNLVFINASSSSSSSSTITTTTINSSPSSQITNYLEKRDVITLTQFNTLTNTLTRTVSASPTSQNPPPPIPTSPTDIGLPEIAKSGF